MARKTLAWCRIWTPFFHPRKSAKTTFGGSPKATGFSAAEVEQALAAGTPRILAVREGDRLAVVMDVLQDREVLAIARRLHQILKG